MQTSFGASKVICGTGLRMSNAAQSIAESVLGAIEWKNETEGFCECPGKSSHTKSNGKKDTKITLCDGRPPTLFCFHASCEHEVAEANKRLRSALGKFEKGQGPLDVVIHKPAPPKTPAPRKYVYSGDGEDVEPYPSPIDNGAVKLLEAAFEPEEIVRISPGWINDDGHEVASAGFFWTRKKAVETIREREGVNYRKGDSGPGFICADGDPGVFVGINPFQPGSTNGADDNVSVFRHCLIEFDELPKPDQWEIVSKSELPITAAIDSGGKSVHAWVRVDAKDLEEWRERTKLVYDYFADYEPDPKNKNPSRFSRLAGCIRLDNRQELLAVGIGKKTFVEWMAAQEIKSVSQPLSFRELLDFDAENDETTILGKRYICEGGLFLIVAPSGIGKSTMVTQMAMTWALGSSLYGVAPARPLKSLIIQAENDKGDIAQQVQGAFSGLGFDRDEHEDFIQNFEENIVFIRDSVHTAKSFCQVVAQLIEEHSPDICWIDPLLSFLGGDVSKQEVVSAFIRNGLNPIAESSGVAFGIIHHTGKPPKDSKAMSNWTDSDLSYLGSGSSDLTNAVRAVMVLRQVNDEGLFSLIFAKRGKRAGAMAKDGNPTTIVYLKHSDTGICWEQTDEPALQHSQKSHEAGEPKRAESAKMSRIGERLGLSRGYDPGPWLDAAQGSSYQYGELVTHGVKFSELVNQPKSAQRIKALLTKAKAVGVALVSNDDRWTISIPPDLIDEPESEPIRGDFF